MPLWQIYHPATAFKDAASKQAFANDITNMYLKLGLPAFYVVTQFHKMDIDNVFVGGKQNADIDTPFIRVVINHIAIHVPDVDAMYLDTTSRLDGVMKPHITDKGYDFEYHVDETERRLWKINGLIPPPFKSAEEQIWVRENRAVPY
ncbi:oxalocrotonate tautomerase [Penicillium taxi]|uniref:oxalocrotonate tautomerase n=1 Tax=Penicillium taxi TaxID=168475 RepID=UPI0025453CD9|nr:oxalocrotonate tautomerase [Penicillium taxi]KAJ5888650.1 oxalocrotonate tautomerase [Penicillium taxi]